MNVDSAMTEHRCPKSDEDGCCRLSQGTDSLETVGVLWGKLNNRVFCIIQGGQNGIVETTNCSDQACCFLVKRNAEEQAENVKVQGTVSRSWKRWMC